MSEEIDQEVVSGVLVLCFLAGLASGLISYCLRSVVRSNRNRPWRVSVCILLVVPAYLHKTETVIYRCPENRKLLNHSTPTFKFFTCTIPR
jgi:hypothetical protein